MTLSVKRSTLGFWCAVALLVAVNALFHPAIERSAKEEAARTVRAEAIRKGWGRYVVDPKTRQVKEVLYYDD
jgi:hypothetical protein